MKMSKNRCKTSSKQRRERLMPEEAPLIEAIRNGVQAVAERPPRMPEEDRWWLEPLSRIEPERIEARIEPAPQSVEQSLQDWVDEQVRRAIYGAYEGASGTGAQEQRAAEQREMQGVVTEYWSQPWVHSGPFPWEVDTTNSTDED